MEIVTVVCAMTGATHVSALVRLLAARKEWRAMRRITLMKEPLAPAGDHKYRRREPMALDL
jgi:hypothetical protein